MFKKMAAIFILLNAIPLLLHAAPLQSGDISQNDRAAAAGTRYVLTAYAGAGGTVSPARATALAGPQKPFKSFIFAPSFKKCVQSVTGTYQTSTTFTYVNALTGAPISSLPAPVGVRVRVLITDVRGDATLAGTFAPVAANAGSNQVVLAGTVVTLNGSLSTGTGPYSWTQLSGPALVSLSGADTPVATFTTNTAGTYLFQLTHGDSSATTTVYVSDSIAQIAKSQCIVCHAGQRVGAGIYANWSSSIHSRSLHSICYGCHVGANTGSHPGTVDTNTVDPTTFITKVAGVNGSLPPGAIFCTYCHSGAHPIPHTTANLITACAACHTRLAGQACGSGDAHSVQDYTKITMTEAECKNCHSYDTRYPTLVAAYTVSIHANGEAFASSCAGCHGGSATGAAHPANTTYSQVNTASFITPIPVTFNVEGKTTTIPAGAIFCTGCHNGSHAIPHVVPVPTSNGVTLVCNNCHTPTGSGDAHTIAGTPTAGAGGCVNCHSVAQPHSGSLVNDNNGVRQIVGAGGEFQQWSHHIVNDLNNARDPIDAQCVVCHLEGTVANGKVSVDPTHHMADASVHLRDCNTNLGQSESSDGEFIWTPSSPNHTAMDQFCMSCHNAAGAATAFSNLSTGGIKRIATPAGRQFSPLNPFGDRIQNNYDGLSRGAVVAVYDQFDPGNTSHHAVRAPRYTLSSAAGWQADHDNPFANISGNNAAKGYTNLRYANGQSYVGTMYDTGKFITIYQPLSNNNGTFRPLADNSQLHCGDCHAAGQWAARGTAAFGAYSAAFGPGVSKFYKQAIGAHGSGNEYMLRNSNGDNSLNPLALVCYICHSSTIYGSGSASTASRVKFTISGVTSAGLPATNSGSLNGNSWTLYNYTSASRAIGPYGTGLLNDPGQQRRGATATTATAHDGVAGTLGGVHCNDDQNNTAGITGLARLNTKSITTAQFYGYTTGNYPSGTGGGNAFGIKCANCHNSGDGANPGYGGIHGNAFRIGGTTTVSVNSTYTTYSATSSGTGTPTSWATTTHHPYRFLPGLGNFRYNGGSDWKMFNNASGRVGCYTLNGKGTDSGPTKVKDGRNFTGANMIDDDNGLLGTWGSCTEHTNNNHAPSRNVLRPTSY